MNTTYFLNLVAGNVFRTQTSPSIPTNYYIGLSTTTPTASGTNITEPNSSAGYSRVQLTNLSTPSNGVITNSADINWTESTGSWGTVTYYVIWDAATGGHALSYGALTSPRSVETSTIISIRANSLSLSVKNAANS